MWLILCLSLDAEVLEQIERLSKSAPEFYKVDYALTITEAAHWSTVRDHDVFVLDSTRPGKGPFGVCALVRSTDPDSFIIFLSDNLADEIDALNAGADIFLIKPRQTKTLRSVVDDLLDRKEGQRARSRTS